jgi:hypothetical protein
VVYFGQVDALKRFKDQVREVGLGFECVISINGYIEIHDFRGNDGVMKVSCQYVKVGFKPARWLPLQIKPYGMQQARSARLGKPWGAGGYVP